MPETPVLINDDHRLHCIIEGESVVFTVAVARDVNVGGLKKLIQKKRDILKGVDPHTLELWKPNDSNPITAEPSDTLVKRIMSLGDLPQFANKLEPTDNVFNIFPKQPPNLNEYLHIIVKISATRERERFSVTVTERY